MAPEVLAAWIAAGASILTLFVGTYVTYRVSRLDKLVEVQIADRSREIELVVTALGHLVGGSQSRGAGIAALKALKETAQTNWHYYEAAVWQVLVTQVQFVLSNGRNRWERHEVANVQAIIKWLTEDDRLSPHCVDRQQVIDAAGDYVKAWRSRSDRVDGEIPKPNDGGRVAADAVRALMGEFSSRGWVSNQDTGAQGAQIKPEPDGEAGGD